MATGRPKVVLYPTDGNYGVNADTTSVYSSWTLRLPGAKKKIPDLEPGFIFKFKDI